MILALVGLLLGFDLGSAEAEAEEVEEERHGG
jgi:hypothetical protein